jgi:hypothetical protein
MSGKPGRKGRPPRSPTPLFGPYSPHANCRPGDSVQDQIRGWVTVGGLEDTPVPWPYAKGRGRHSPILTGDLVRAVQREAGVVVSHLFGVGRKVVWQWRQALGLPRSNAGTHEVIGASKRGMARPLTAAQRKKLSTLNSPSAARRHWTAAEDELLRILHPAEVAQRTQRTMAAVYIRRRRLAITRLPRRPVRVKRKPTPGSRRAKRRAERVVAMFRKGERPADIALFVQLSKQRVSQILRASDFDPQSAATSRAVPTSVPRAT